MPEAALLALSWSLPGDLQWKQTRDCHLPSLLIELKLNAPFTKWVPFHDSICCFWNTCRGVFWSWKNLIIRNKSRYSRETLILITASFIPENLLRSLASLELWIKSSEESGLFLFHAFVEPPPQPGLGIPSHLLTRATSFSLKHILMRLDTLVISACLWNAKSRN